MNNTIIIGTTSLYIIVLIIDFVITKNLTRVFLELLVLSTALIVALSWPVSSLVSFGDDPNSNPILIIILLFLCIIIGMVANYFFNMRAKFSWFSFVKPFFISPIIMLPLLGTIDYSDVKTVQMISLSFLAFQNGFFWKEIFNRVQTSQRQQNN